MASNRKSFKKRKHAAAFIGLLVVEEKKKRKLYRHIWTRDWLKKREEKGAFHTIFQELSCYDEAGFHEYTRMDAETFEALLGAIEPHISKKNTTMREAIKPAERLALTLRYLATGESFHSLSFQFRISRQAISYIVVDVCETIASIIGGKSMVVPSTEAEWQKIEDDFKAKWDFPNCIGAIDGKHIILQQPDKSGSHFRNYKGTDSIVLLAVVGPSYEFLYTDVGANGRMSDGGIWNRCPLKKCLTSPENPLNIPGPKPLPSTSRVKPIPSVLVGDEAFSLTNYLMKPFPQSQLESEDNRIFNYRLSRCRRVAENAFGILSNCWRIFHSPILVGPDKATSLVLATVALHNWLRNSPKFSCSQLQPTNEEVTPSKTWLPFHPECSNNYGQTAKAIREEFRSYFSNEGAVKWQWKMCGLD